MHAVCLTSVFAHSLAISFALATPARAQKREIMAATGAGLTSIDQYCGINDAGTVAFTGVDASGSRAFVATLPNNYSAITFFSANRIFTGAAINNAGTPDVATRDRVTGAPPIYLIRKWPASGSQAFTTIGLSPTHFDSATSYVDVNDGGVVAFQALVSGSTQTALMAGSASHAPTLLAVWNGSHLIRPQISNNNKIVIRDNLTRIQAWPYPSGVPEHFAGTTQGFTSLGSAPGISRDGTVAAFCGDRGAGKGVFLSVPYSGGKWICRAAGEGSGTLSDVLLDDRVAVSSSGDTFSGLGATVVFNGTNNGVSGVWAVGVHAIETGGGVTVKTSAVCPVVAVGDTISAGNVVASCALFDPLNDKLKVGVRVAFASGATGVLRCGINPRSALPALTTPKYTQFDASYANACLISGQAPSCAPAGTFIQYGCTLSAFTTAVTRLLANNGYSTTGITPVAVQQYLFARGLQNSPSGTLAVENSVYEKIYGTTKVRIATKRGTQNAPFVFTDIVSELKAGRPVLLCVPSCSNKHSYETTISGAKSHYVVAYAYDEAVGAAFGQSAGVLIVDPGYGASSYGTAGVAGYAPGFTGAANDPTHVSLHDYFAATSRRTVTTNATSGTATKANYYGCWGDDAKLDDQRVRQWFDSGTVWRTTGGPAQSIPASKRKQLVTKFTFSTSPAPSPAPTVSVHSPLQIALTETTSGQTWVSSASIAGPGDIVLTPEFPIQPDPVDSDDTNGVNFVDPPYLLELPSSLYGKSFNVALHGTGSGSYSVMLHHLDESFVAPPPLAGSITNGQVINGALTLTPNCAASVQLFCTAKTNSLGCVPAMSSTGFASASSAAAFTVGASNVLNNRSGILFYGYAQTVSPFQGGTKCVAPPTLRTPIQSSGGSASGTDCSGQFSMNFNAFIQSGVDAQLVSGEEVYAQYWSRDPADTFHTNLTDALRFVICP